MPEPSSEPLAGRHIGRYEVRRLLGAGGFSRVYLAHDPELEIDVAIKLPKPELAADAEALERFRREATTAARLRHPNVVTVLTVGRLEAPFEGVDEGAPYLVMDYLPESLTARLAATPALPEGEWLRIGREVARGLAYAHAQGVVHRDVKPDNILFGRHGEAVVTDFGIARAMSERVGSNSLGMVVGTPEYFSPEQARGLPIDGRTDVYALGVTLYRMATGTLPFGGDDWYAIMRQHVEDEPRPIHDHDPAISEAADAIVRRCLAKQPADRFQTASELAAAISTIAPQTERPAFSWTSEHTVAIHGAEAATIEIARAPGGVAARRRWLARGAVVVGSAALTVAALTMWRQRSAAPLAPTTTPPAPVDSVPAVDTSAKVARDGADSARAPTPVRSDTPRTRPATPAVASLSVATLPNATIFVDERYAGTGSWHSDSIRAGRHQLRASVPSIPGCATADDASSVTLARGAQRQVTLRPQPCGRFELSGSPSQARFTITRDGAAVADGRIPLDNPLVLPEGTYRLLLEAPRCQSYTGTIEIDAARLPEPKIVRLVCS